MGNSSSPEVWSFGVWCTFVGGIQGNTCFVFYLEIINIINVIDT